MPSLPDVTQTFEANVGPYIADLARAAEAARAFAEDAAKAAAAAAALGLASGSSAAMLQELGRAAEYAMIATGQLAGIERDLGDVASSSARSEGLLAAILDRLQSIMGQLTRSAMADAAALKLQAAAARNAAAANAATVAAIKALGTEMDTATSGGGARFLGWAGLTRQALHWIVMGTLEFASVAIPALVALGAAAMGMYPTFTRIFDATNNLIVASGGLRNALLNSVGPLHNLGVSFGQTAKMMQPDAYVIFGAIINSLSSRFGVFNGIAQKAGIILANFATKIQMDLAGQGGKMLADFFSHAIQDFTVFGQLLGTLGHIFLILSSDMLGVGRDVFSVLNMIAQAILHVVQIPFVGTMIGWLAALSALVRWGGLVVIAFNFLISPIKLLVSFLTTAIPLVLHMGETFDILAADIGTADAAMAIFEALLGGLAIVGAIAAFLLWRLSISHTTDAVDVLISKLNKLPPTVHNLTSNIAIMSARALTTASAMDKLAAAQMKIAQGGTSQLHALNASRDAMIHYQNDIIKSISAIHHWASELLNLETGLAQTGAGTRQVAAGMQAMEIQTALADSKVQALNQALDQYMQIVTGGTSGVANFITSLGNIGNVAATTSNNLGTATVQMNISMQNFGKAMVGTSLTAASAVQNFDQVLNGSVQPLADWGRTALQIGATTGPQLTAAIKNMAQVMGQYAGSNVTAQAKVLAFARANGLVANNFQQLMKGALPVPKALQQISNWANITTQHLSNLSQMAKNAAAALSGQVAQSLAKVALESSGFNKALEKYQTDLLNTHTPQAVLQADIRAMQGDLKIASDLVIKSGNATQTGMTHSSTSTTNAKGVINPAIESIITKHLKMDQETGTVATNVSNHHAKMASNVKTSSTNMNNAMQSTIGKAQALQGQFNSMKPFNIVNHVTTVFATQGSPSAGTPGLGYPYHGAVMWQQHGGVMGFQGGGYVGSGMGGMDRIPAMLTLGEGVLTKAATAALGGPLGIRNLNDNPYLASGAGRDTGTINLTIINPVSIDGHAINSQQRTETLIYNRRNPTNNLTLRNR